MREPPPFNGVMGTPAPEVPVELLPPALAVLADRGSCVVQPPQCRGCRLSPGSERLVDSRGGKRVKDRSGIASGEPGLSAKMLKGRSLTWMNSQTRHGNTSSRPDQRDFARQRGPDWRLQSTDSSDHVNITHEAGHHAVRRHRGDIPPAVRCRPNQESSSAPIAFKDSRDAAQRIESAPTDAQRAGHQRRTSSRVYQE